MGTLIGHIAPGFAFILIGLWHLFNHTKLFSLDPKSYRSRPWFPHPRLRHLELLLIAAGSLASIAMELFIGPSRHQPLDADLTIPSNHLHNFEHASISFAFLLFAALAFTFDTIRPARPAAEPLTVLAASAAFAMELFLFRLHSSDHMGVEGRYHAVLQMVIAVSVVTTVMGIGYPGSFAAGFVRSASVLTQGIWFVVMGCALWVPGLVAKGCFMNDEDGHFMVRCRSEEALHRAKALANIEFSWILAAVVGFSMVFYVVVSRRYLVVVVEEEEEEDFDLESEKTSFVSLKKGMKSFDLER